MTIEITLSNGGVALIDDADYALVSKHTWKAIGKTLKYARSGNLSMHRVIMDAPADMVVDHINGRTLDNRRSNLRICTRVENMRNQRLAKNNTTGYKGVSLHKAGRYRASICVNRNLMFLGTFACPIRAALAYDRAA